MLFEEAAKGVQEENMFGILVWSMIVLENLYLIKTHVDGYFLSSCIIRHQVGRKWLV